MPAPDAVKRLVDRFDQDRKVFLSGDYKEEQLRLAFPNGPSLSIRHSDLASAAPVGQRVVRTSPGPFFTVLGWDMDNKQGLSEFSVIASSVHGSWPIVSGTEDRKPVSNSWFLVSGSWFQEPRTKN